jgi:hypothetical protein
VRVAGLRLALRRITGLAYFLDDCRRNGSRSKQILVALDVRENGIAAHNGSVEQPVEVLEVGHADFEGAGVVEFLRGAQQHGVYVSNDAVERLLGQDQLPPRLFGQLFVSAALSCCVVFSR